MEISPSIFELISGLPGEEFVEPALQDLRSGKVDTVGVVLLLIAQSRLARSGFSFLEEIEYPTPSAEHQLYQKLGEIDPKKAYQNYNSLKRRLDSFIRALEGRIRRNNLLLDS